MLPVLKVRVLTSTFPLKVMPLGLLRVKAFNDTAGSAVEAPLPPIVMLEAAPPVNEPLVTVIPALMVMVLAPILRAPFVKVNVELRVKSWERVRLLVRLIVKAVIDGAEVNVPAGITKAAPPVPKTRLLPAAVVIVPPVLAMGVSPL